MEDYGKMTSYTTGFNHQWSAIGAAEHMTPEDFDAAATEFFENNWMTPRAMIEMNWPKTLELLDTAEADVVAFTDAFVRPVNDFLLNVFWTAEEYYEVAAWIIGWETLEFAWDVEYTMEYALETVSDYIWDIMYCLMDIVWSLEAVIGYAVWCTYDLLSWAFDGILTVDDVLYDGLVGTITNAGWVLLGLVSYAAYLVWDFFYEANQTLKWGLSMIFDCSQYEVYYVGYDIAGLHIPYWDVLLGAIFMLFW